MLVWYFCVHQGVPQLSLCMWPSLKNTQELGAFGMLLRGHHQASGLRRAVVSPWQALNPRHCRRSTRDKWYSLHGSRLGGPHLCKMWGEISSGILLSIEKNNHKNPQEMFQRYTFADHKLLIQQMSASRPFRKGSKLMPIGISALVMLRTALSALQCRKKLRKKQIILQRLPIFCPQETGTSQLPRHASKRHRCAWNILRHSETIQHILKHSHNFWHF